MGLIDERGGIRLIDLRACWVQGVGHHCHLSCWGGTASVGELGDWSHGQPPSLMLPLIIIWF